MALLTPNAAGAKDTVNPLSQVKQAASPTNVGDMLTGGPLKRLFGGSDPNQNKVEEIYEGLTDKDLIDQQKAAYGADFSHLPGQLIKKVRFAHVATSLANLRAQQQSRNAERAKQAKEVAAINNQKSQMLNQYGDSARKGLAADMAGVTKSANRRGLLYSGLKTGAEQDLRQQAASGYGAYQSQLNKASKDKLTDYQGRVAERGIAKYGLDNNVQQSQYEDALAQRKLQGQQMGQIGGALGTLGGTAFGAKGK